MTTIRSSASGSRISSSRDWCPMEKLMDDQSRKFHLTTCEDSSSAISSQESSAGPSLSNSAGWEGPVWTGSCPCQPLSSAGQRKGHADERHLWPAFQQLISECRPSTFVFGEQVASKDGREWFAAVRADLEHMGYACGAADLSAAGVGAPHIRQRLYWVANT